MKEKERFAEMLAYLKGNRIDWGIEIHDHRIWHAIVKFPLDYGYNCEYTRGYSILAHMDIDLDEETKLVRGPLISIGRALKAEGQATSVSLVANSNIADYLRNNNCPSNLTDDGFYKGQFNVRPTPTEFWLIHHRAYLPNGQRGRPSYGPGIAPPSQVDPLVEYLNKELPLSGKWIERNKLVSQVFRTVKRDPDTGLAPEDVKKLFDMAWLRENGFTLEFKSVLVRA